MTLTPERLRRLVRHRDRLERVQEIRVAAAQRRRGERARALAESRDRRVALLSVGVPGGVVVDIETLASTVAHMVALDREIAARTAALSHSDDEVGLEMGSLLERRRDRKAVETLLDRQMEEARLARAKADTRRMDELAGRRWWAARGRKEAG